MMVTPGAVRMVLPPVVVTPDIFLRLGHQQLQTVMMMATGILMVNPGAAKMDLPPVVVTLVILLQLEQQLLMSMWQRALMITGVKIMSSSVTMETVFLRAGSVIMLMTAETIVMNNIVQLKGRGELQLHMLGMLGKVKLILR